MLEVFYETATKTVTAWRNEGFFLQRKRGYRTKRISRQGIRPVREGEAKVMLDILPPSDEGATVRDYIYDGVTQTLILRPEMAQERG